MESNNTIRAVCSEEFAELCALSTAGVLTDDERCRLEHHLLNCDVCRERITDYRRIVLDGAAKMAGDTNINWEENAVQGWDQGAARNKLIDRLGSVDNDDHVEVAPRELAAFFRHPLPILFGTTALILISLFVGYRVAEKRFSNPVPQVTAAGAALQRELSDLRSEDEAIKVQLNVAGSTISRMSEHLARKERELAELEGRKDAIDSQLQRATGENRRQNDAINVLIAQRDILQHKLEDSEQALQEIREDLNRHKDNEQRVLLRASSLELRIDELSAQLRESSHTIQQQRDYLSSDRDIRELMGARQLYIADVFDVDHNGRKRAPFGRVFYTKGKSLIFYAFDLDQPAGYRNAKAFQVWGSQSEDQSKAVSLGVFYKDSEANRRWIFKTDDPAVLAQINAVFVTVEPNGPKNSPSGKPILYAYLRSAPANHP